MPLVAAALGAFLLTAAPDAPLADPDLTAVAVAEADAPPRVSMGYSPRVLLAVSGSALFLASYALSAAVGLASRDGLITAVMLTPVIGPLTGGTLLLPLGVADVASAGHSNMRGFFAAMSLGLLLNGAAQGLGLALLTLWKRLPTETG